ncbi:disease resistance protein RGA2-like [Pistacia vera]|uniref:disease resistance protein RGA2-like n=1 Tax=Pistacia vera TaxID=55513 RepID=UPI00126336BD|nr:disease resistance protein RGA2-like [Pistacia vera]
MARAIVSCLQKYLVSLIPEWIQQETRLVVGVDEEVKKLTSNLDAIEAVLLDAEEREVKERDVRLWLDRLKYMSYDIEDVLDEWNYAVLKQQIEGVPPKKVHLSSPSSSSYQQAGLRLEIAVKIKEFNEKLDVIVKQKDMYDFKVSRSVGKFERVQSTSFVDVSNICGRVEEKNTLVCMLCETSDQHPHIISIIGMGGIGKTTVAQFASKDNEVINNFDKVIWVCVSEPFDEYRIAKAIIEALEGFSSNLGELESLFQRISRSIAEKKFLLILDDVWSDDYKKWEPLYCCLKNGLHDSKILITTRKESVAHMMESIDTIAVKELPDEECWLMFKRFAFFGRSQAECENLEEIGKKVLNKCKGLPLAVKTIGSLLCFRQTREGWQNILDSDLWKLEVFEKNIFGPLQLSYNDLPFKIKRCFTYCAIFPKDHNIERDYLIKLWMAHGYLKQEGNDVMGIVGQEYFDYLASRSLFQDFVKDDHDNIVGCKMHDLVHDFAQFLTKNECLHIEVNGLKEPIINSSYHEQVFHLMVTGHDDERTPIPLSICSLKRLRSFILDKEAPLFITLPSNMFTKLFGELTCLKALTISFIGRDFPKGIEKLIHLRYLHLVNRGMRKLPEELCGLYNLQTLDVNECQHLQELPQGIGKLINLRHLENDPVYDLRYMPIGIQRLTNLRTLRKFFVGNDDKACSLEGLKYLNPYGDLCIDKLGNVSNVDEARRLELKNQKNLLHLTLDFRKDEEEWTNEDDELEEDEGERTNEDDESEEDEGERAIEDDEAEEDGERTNEDDETLLEILQPPLNLEKLHIWNYRGNTISPNWMMSLSKLKDLKLSNSINCKHLPPLGKLSSLESLCIYSMRSLKRVSNEFLGIESDGTSSSFIFFPKLKTLAFRYMNEWEEWDYKITRKGDEEDDIKIMPSLVSLEIWDCPKLKALPAHLGQNTALKKHIGYCPLLGYPW